MKRTTVFLDEPLEGDLRMLARRERRPMAEMVREAINEYVARAKRRRTERLGFVAAGASGRTDTAERHEELLWADLEPHGGKTGKPARRRRGQRRR